MPSLPIDPAYTLYLARQRWVKERRAPRFNPPARRAATSALQAGVFSPFPLLGPLGMLPLATKGVIRTGEPIALDLLEPDSASDEL